MKTRPSNLLVTFGVVAALTVGMVTTPQAHAQAGQEIELSQTEIMTALVVAIDKQDRTVTLLGSRGDVVTFEVGSEVKDFDRIQVGDHVNVEYYASVALYLGEPGTQPTADAGLIVARAPRGEQPARVAVGAVDVSAQVQDIDRSRRTVTLEGHDGRVVTFKVDKRMKAFDTLRVGDAIHARFTEAIAVSLERAMPQAHANDMTLLFVQSAKGISYDSVTKTLTLEPVSPVVIFFADRPYRIAGHILLPAFLQLWNEGADSFKKDPPNASLSILDAGQVKSAVIEIANPQLSNDRLTYQVVNVLEGDLSSSGGVSSLFIDGLLQPGGLRGGARGAAGGAIIGAIAGDAGKGAAIGAGVGVVGGALRKGHDEKVAAQQQAAQQQAAAQAQLTTRVINVPNANGSFTPVTLHLVQNGWQGPRGEIYPTLPTVDQLQQAYGVK
jgi:hypothetical protein